MSDSEATPISVDSERSMKSRESCLCGREVCIKVTAMLGYFVLLLWRFVGLILFSIHVTDCLFRERHASYRCKNFTLFSHANELQVAWQMASFINAVIVIVVLLKVPGYQGYLSTLRNNWKHARFWSLFFQFLAAVSFKIVVISTEPPGVSTLVVFGYIFMEVSTVFVVYLWNGVPTPWKLSGVPILRVARGAYVVSLLIFFLENFFLFIITSAQVASQVTGLSNSSRVSSALQVIAVVLNAAEATFNYCVMKFFWNKFFYGGRNLLISDSV